MKDQFYKNKQRGAALAISLIAATGIAVLATLIIRLSGEQAKNHMQLKSKVSEGDLITEISKELLDVTSCRNTLLPLGAIAVNPTLIRPISSIKNRSDAPTYNTGAKYFGGSVKLESIGLTKVNYAAVASGGFIGTADLQLIVDRSKAGVFAMGKRTHTIGLRLELTAARVVNRCFATEDNAIAGALEKFCASVSIDNTSFSLATHLCILVGYTPLNDFPPALNDPSLLVSSAYLFEMMNGLESRYVNVTGDTMTGDLNSTANFFSTKFLATDKICVGANCHRFDDSICPVQPLATGVNGAGMLECTFQNCGVNQFVEGTTTMRNANCKNLPTSSCAANEYVTSIQPNGSVLCSPIPAPSSVVCPTNNYIRAINASSVPTCYPMVIDTNTNMYNKSCGGYFLRGASSNGVAICTQPCPCGACGATRAVPITCSVGIAVAGTDTCVSSGWVRSVNPYCYCPCGACGTVATIPASCTTGTPIAGSQQCSASGWVVTSNPWCQCAGCVCNTTRTISSGSGTTVINQVCRTSGWVTY